MNTFEIKERSVFEFIFYSLNEYKRMFIHEYLNNDTKLINMKNIKFRVSKYL